MSRIPTAKVVACTAQRFLTSLIVVNPSSLKQRGRGGRKIFSKEVSQVQALGIVRSHAEIGGAELGEGTEPVGGLELPLLPSACSRTQAGGY